MVVRTIRLVTDGGDYVADWSRADAVARQFSHRQLVRQVAELWPELWGKRGHSLSVDERAWRIGVRSLGRLELAVMLVQK